LKGRGFNINGETSALYQGMALHAAEKPVHAKICDRFVSGHGFSRAAKVF
jgi:hypothetical protein